MAEEGVLSGNLSYLRSADMRYVGQEYSINVPVSPEPALDTLIGEFHSAYRRRYGHSSPRADVEFVNLRVAAIGALGRYGHPGSSDGHAGDDAVPGERSAVFNGRRHATPVLRRDRLPPTFRGKGPVIIEEQSATTVVPPGWSVAVDAHENLLLNK